MIFITLIHQRSVGGSLVLPGIHATVVPLEAAGILFGSSIATRSCGWLR